MMLLGTAKFFFPLYFVSFFLISMENVILISFSAAINSKTAKYNEEKTSRCSNDFHQFGANRFSQCIHNFIRDMLAVVSCALRVN